MRTNGIFIASFINLIKQLRNYERTNDFPVTGTWFSVVVMQKYINFELVKDTAACHGLVHHGASDCLKHFFIKLHETGKVASKYYIFFHLIPLVLRLRKVKKVEDLPKIILSSTKEYARSILFMSFLVGLLRAGLCVIYSPQKTILVNSLGKFKSK